MSWFSSRGTPAKGRDSAAGSGGAVEVHRSLGLAALFEGIGDIGKLQVLDLGPAIGSNIEYLSRYGCKLYIEDLYAALAARPLPRVEERMAPEVFAEALPFPDGTLFDAVLAWDRFNYLGRKELGALGSFLARYCRPGALLLALVAIGKQIPQQPYRFRIVDSEHLAYERQGSGERPWPRYAPAELSDLMRGFRLDRSYLMRHGIQEYLFRRVAP